MINYLFCSTGINDFKNIHKELTVTEKPLPSHLKISSDDIFSGLSDIWNSKVDKNQNTASSIDSITPNIDKTYEGSSNDTFENHWLRIRGIMTNMRSIFMEMYVKDFDQSKYGSSMDIMKLLDRLLELGDKINLIKQIENNFDNDLIDFLLEKWTKTKESFTQMTPDLGNLMNMDAKVLLLTVAKGLVKQFGHRFHRQALAHVNEQDFIIRTMRTSGFKDEEILSVFNLLDLPTKELISTSNSLTSEDAFTGRQMGYYQRQQHDPITLLAGLGFATFGAYLIYRLLSTTAAAAAGGGRSSSDIFSISMSLSDMPGTLTKIYDWLDNAKSVYDDSASVS